MYPARAKIHWLVVEHPSSPQLSLEIKLKSNCLSPAFRVRLQRPSSMYIHKSRAPLMSKLIRLVKYSKFPVQTVWATQDGTTLISVGRMAQKKKKARLKIPSHGCGASWTRIALASRPPDERAGGDLVESDGDGGRVWKRVTWRRLPHLQSFSFFFFF